MQPRPLSSAGQSVLHGLEHCLPSHGTAAPDQRGSPSNHPRPTLRTSELRFCQVPRTDTPWLQHCWGLSSAQSSCRVVQVGFLAPTCEGTSLSWVGREHKEKTEPHQHSHDVCPGYGEPCTPPAKQELRALSCALL